MAKDFDRRTLFDKLNAHFAVMGKKFEDFEKMFKTKKGVSPAQFFGLTPEMAEKLAQNEAVAHAPAGPAPQEHYGDPPPSTPAPAPAR
jgi:hypothetical protein